MLHNPEESREYTRNRNFIRSVTEGSIVVIPRPEHGIAHLGRISGPFEIVDDPPWAQTYLDVRGRQDLDLDDQNHHHVADVAQGWPVEDDFVPVDLPRLPGWLRKSLLGRSTYNVLQSHPLDPQTSALDVLDNILIDIPPPPTDWTLDVETIKRRLVDALNNPCAFENLVVSLLQLEHPNETWHHTGGPGDGGVDGMASDEANKVVAIMQAKYYADSAPRLSAFPARPLRRYAAVLLPPDPRGPPNGTRLLDLHWIACAVKRHWHSLPLARALRVGEG